MQDNLKLLFHKINPKYLNNIIKFIISIFLPSKLKKPKNLKAMAKHSIVELKWE